MVVLFSRIPTAFLPEEDQGILICVVQLAPGATMSRTVAVNKAIDDYFNAHEAANINGVFTAAGFGFTGQGQNTALAFVSLKNWSQRHGAANRASAIAARAFQGLSQVRDAMIFPVVPPAVPELGTATGFDLELEDIGNVGHQRLVAAEYQLLGMAAKDHLLQGVRPNGLPDVAQLQVNVDRPHATALGLSLSDVNDTLSAAWGGEYVDDFLDRGRVKHVYIEGDAPYRTKPDDLNHWYVRGTSGALAPFSAFANESWTFGPAQLSRYNGMPAMELLGQPAPGISSGAATHEMDLLAKRLPPGVALEPTGLSYEEAASGGKTGILYALSIIVVFLCLAALYESWSVPVAVILVIPLGIIGAVLAVTLRGFNNDVFFQVGLLTTMGLAAKNAILIVEFAESAYRSGKTALDSALEAARLRLRPILMTSLAFIAGVAPLAVSSGAGSGSQNDIGTSVVGGMISATFLAIFFVPLFYVLVRMVFKDRPPIHTPADEISDANVQGA
jgi:hydrophobe/amphiphile efflux-1 (HAE1) family protein